MRKVVLSLLLFLVSNFIFSICTSNGTGGGTWDVASTWVCSPESSPPSNPSCPDSIIIQASDSIYIDKTVDLISCGPVYIIIEGVLKFKTGNKLKIASGSLVEIKPGGIMRPGGGGGSSNYLEIGGNQVWTAGDGDALGPISYDATGILPIELISFIVNVNEDRVEIKWITASEVNNDYFTIEKSSNGKKWEQVSIVKGAGNSNQIVEYFESDYSPIKGISYYRLKQTDFNGAYSYSSVVPVKYVKNNNEPSISLFPSPVNRGKEVKIMFNDIFEEKILVVLRDVKGQDYYSKVILNVEDGVLTAIPIDSSLKSGVYLVTASSENQIYSKKILVK